MHTIFVQQGATNAVWVWCPTAWKFIAQNPWPPIFYPGDEYVDWVAADGYNWAPNKPGAQYRTFAQTFQAFYDWAATTGKPIMLAEVGTVENNPGDKAAWITGARDVLKTSFAMVQAFVYFDTRVANNGITYDWRANTSPSSYDAFKAMAADPYFNPRSSPDTQPPTVPGKPVGTSSSPGEISLSWAASVDDRASTIAYRVFRDGGGVPVGTVQSASTTTVSFTDSGLAQGSVHTYRVDASDGTNTSALSTVSDPITVASGQVPVFADSFTSGLGAWTSVTNLALDGTSFPPSDTAPSVRASVSGLKAFAYHNLGSAYPSLCMSEAVNLSSIGPSAVALLKLRTAANQSVARVFANPSRILMVRGDVSGLTFSSGRALPTGWNTIELCATVGTSGTLSLWLNGSQIGTWTTNNGTSPITRLQIGDDAAKTVTVNFDEVVAHA